MLAEEMGGVQINVDMGIYSTNDLSGFRRIKNKVEESWYGEF